MGERLQSQKKFACSFVNCESTFSKSWKLQAHLCKHTGLKPFSCETCEKSFCTRYQLTRHQLSHSGEKPFKCLVEGCSEAFTTHASMKNHMTRIHQHQEKRFKCDHLGCGKDFKKKYQLSTHKCEHSQLLPFHCNAEGCKREFPTSRKLRCHEKVHRGYPCEVEGCLFQGKTWTDYQKHRKEHRVRLQCDGCRKKFWEAWFLHLHKLWIHSGERRLFRCPKQGCERTFTTRFNLDSHVTGEHEHKKDFPCSHPGCGKSFVMKESLRRHGVMHDPEKKKLVKQKSQPQKMSTAKKTSESVTRSTRALTSGLASRLRNASLEDCTP
ncbi:general transcription factor IIIA, b [Osmerus mordax]|uniref:general transcription factor IIIA, b n=1 Tax=Osmerus mordax TaxID=8014 RepID=UPI00350F1E15